MWKVLALSFIAAAVAYALLFVWGEPSMTSYKWWVMAGLASISFVALGYSILAIIEDRKKRRK